MFCSQWHYFGYRKSHYNIAILTQVIMFEFLILNGSYGCPNIWMLVQIFGIHIRFSLCFLSNCFFFEMGTVLHSQTELKVDASVVRSGRNLTVIAVEFKIRDSEKLVYTSRATFYNMPVASLWSFPYSSELRMNI